MRIERNNNIFKDLYVWIFLNLNFIEEIIYLIFFFESNEKYV